MHVDDPQTMRKLVLEVDPGLFQRSREAWASKGLRVAAQAEAQGIYDIVAASLPAFLCEERHDPARPRIDDARVVEVEPEIRIGGFERTGIGRLVDIGLAGLAGLGRNKVLGEALHRGQHGDRDPGRHQPARAAPGE
ncbi:hypothetical protein NKH36_18335 [Mesorhizobium sp. M1312]|uniref:hypothetical protein n=1 Tax=unclassified Mesorhizobium TaxID=325217 RepID=UPI0033388DAA